MQAFGPVLPEAGEPTFHAEWERRVFALAVAMGASGKWNIDTSRAARESMPPAQYLASSYYEIWFAGLTRLLLASGLVSAEELGSGRVMAPAVAGVNRLSADKVASALAGARGFTREIAVPARFKTGDAVTTLEMNPRGHTRLPRYCRGKTGVVVAWHGAHVFPDSNAAGRGESPCHLYGVRFEARELWGPDTTAASVSVDCWEPYLEPATVR